MNKVIVTTTIYPPSEATLKFAKKRDWNFVIVGDKKTPHDKYDNVDAIYLHPDKQERLYKDLSDAIGWNKIMRRNIGFVYAYHELKADIIASVDDDNIPYDDWGKDIYIGQTVNCDYYETDLYVADPLSVTNVKQMWHRGYPLELIKYRHQVEYKGKREIKPLIQADLWDGDPDIDAMVRLTQNELVKFSVQKPYFFNKPAPFNSQNTFLAREVVPYYTVLPYAGRMDDIWGGYILQQKFPNSLIFNRASVYQDRNKQDLIKNLENETIGYRNTTNFLKGMTSLDLPFISEETRNFYKVYRSYFR
jgi:hypothetical protein